MKRYRFPEKLDQFRCIDSDADFNAKFAEEMKHTGVNFMYNKKIHEGFPISKLMFYCVSRSLCGWGMMYQKRKKKNEDKVYYILTNFNLYHDHPEHSQGTYTRRFEFEDKFNSKSAHIQIEVFNALRDLNSMKQLAVNYLSLLSGLSPMSINAISCPSKSESEQTLSFLKWYKIYSRKNLNIFMYPPPEKLVYIPEIILISCLSAKKLYSLRGHIVGIKILENKINQFSTNLSNYICVIFYGIFGSQLSVIYSFGIMSPGFTLEKQIQEEVEEVHTEERRDMKSQSCESKVEGKLNSSNVQKTLRTRKLSVNLNLYKLIRVFMQKIGRPITETFVLEYRTALIDTVHYFCHEWNRKKNKCKENYAFEEDKIPRPERFSHGFKRGELSYIVDPLSFVKNHKCIPESQLSTILRLAKSKSHEQFESIYRTEIKKILNIEEHQAMEEFYSNKSEYMIFNPDRPRFVGKWFESEYQQEYDETIIDSRNMGRSMVQMLSAVSNTFSHQNKMYVEQFTKLVEHSTVENCWALDNIRDIRLSTYREGFRTLMRQIYDSMSVSIVSMEYHGFIRDPEQPRGSTSQNCNEVQSCSQLMKNVASSSSQKMADLEKPLSDYYSEYSKKYNIDYHIDLIKRSKKQLSQMLSLKEDVHDDVEEDNVSSEGNSSSENQFEEDDRIDVDDSQTKKKIKLKEKLKNSKKKSKINKGKQKDLAKRQEPEIKKQLQNQNENYLEGFTSSSEEAERDRINKMVRHLKPKRGRPKKGVNPQYPNKSKKKYSRFSPMFASYEQLYPLKPKSTVEVDESLPTKVLMRDSQGQYYCYLKRIKKREKKPKQPKKEESKNQQENKIGLKVDGIFEERGDLSCSEGSLHLKKRDVEHEEHEEEAEKENSENDREEFFYECECQFQEFRGIPCKHIIKLCLKYSLSMLRYLHPYWVLESRYDLWREHFWYSRGLQVPKQGRPKNTKRNRMRFR